MPVDTCSTSRETTGQLFLLGLLIVALLGTLYSRAGEGGSPLILPLLPISSVCVVSWHLFSLLHLHALSQWEVTSLCLPCLASSQLHVLFAIFPVAQTVESYFLPFLSVSCFFFFFPFFNMGVNALCVFRTVCTDMGLWVEA